MKRKTHVFFIVLLVWFVTTVQAAVPGTTILRKSADGTMILAQGGSNFGFFMPETGGYLLTGLMVGTKSLWLKDAQSVQSKPRHRGWILQLKDPILGTGELQVRVQPLSDCNGLILEVIGKNLPDGTVFFWAFGGGSSDTLNTEKTVFLQPEQCLNNVFSREINAFTMYYGTTARLKVMMGVMPLNTETRLSDARTMLSPVALWNSGKKTDAPLLSGSNPLANNQPNYYCIYRQNQLADFNYYMLPALFEKESALKNTITNEQAKPHSDFGPDFHQH